MLTYESAAEIAQVFAPGSRFAAEKSDAYIFRSDAEESIPVIILKKNGKIIPAWQYGKQRKRNKGGE